jgi:hypothetical protein
MTNTQTGKLADRIMRATLVRMTYENATAEQIYDYLAGIVSVRGYREPEQQLKPAKFPKGEQTLTHDGETLPISEWAERLGVHKVTIRRRLSDGKTIAETLSAKPRGSITYNGETHTTHEWAEKLGLTYGGLLYRLRSGQSIAQALTPDQQRGAKPGIYTFNDQSLTLKQWAELKDMKPNTLHARIIRGMTIEEALTLPVGSARQKLKAGGRSNQGTTSHNRPHPAMRDQGYLSFSKSEVQP